MSKASNLVQNPDMPNFQPNQGISGNCKHFEYCSAPMCPRDRDVSNTTWFADEAICRLQDVPEWVKRQRKIAKTDINETAGCFTLPMLERRCMIKKGMTGIDPDCTDIEWEAAEKIWLEKHSEKKPIPDEEREKRTARFGFAKGVRLGKVDQKTG
jgi:hypothetical protein